LGDSNGDDSDNVEVYNWDYGTSYNPHLIKLIDATQYYPNYVADVDETSCDNECQADLMLQKFPSSKLCTKSEGNAAKFGSDAYDVGFCSQLNPPGFYSALFFDELNYAANPFRLYNRAATFYGTSTQFFVFTTKGYLNLVNPDSVAFTHSYEYSSSQMVNAFYSNELHLSNQTTSKSHFDGYAGNIDCETNSIGENGARDCLNKNDWVMVFASGGTGVSDATALASNPAYLNMYQVKKIFREDKSKRISADSYTNPNSEKIRNQIKLSYSMNAAYQWHGGNTTATDASAWVYKFHPSTTNSDGGYKYVAECSNRGICNTETGSCECFHGYTSDNCGTINALAQ
jgi:hypothetical protein